MDAMNASNAAHHARNPQNLVHSNRHHHHHSHGMSNSEMPNGHALEHDHGPAVGNPVMIDENGMPIHGDLAENHQDLLISEGGIENGDQLTLSFQGQVYVFDSVSPEKVQAVLLLLGGSEVPLDTASPSLGANNIAKENSSAPERFSVPQRLASLIRFREKRKDRNFDKKIRYAVRKEVALRMQRNKGQFTSAKAANDEASSLVTSFGSNEYNVAEANDGSHQEAICRHCGTSEKSTPMMRRGPDGPRSLCNACGLMWANKGSLRDLNKSSTSARPGQA